MEQDSAIYIIDVYEPNKGEPESALELTILSIRSVGDLPTVHVHTYLQPTVDLNLIHWSEAENYGLRRSMFKDSHWPTLKEIVSEEYLRNKFVICFCSSMEPVQTLIRNCTNCYSLINMWQQLFQGNDKIASINTHEEMLEYMGLPAHDMSNVKYTPLMKRVRSYIAIWCYLHRCETFNRTPSYGDISMSQSVYWPLQDIRDPWYDPYVKELTDIPEEAICQYFSDRLPEYFAWQGKCIYVNDWVFGRKRLQEIHLKDKYAMLNFIYSNVFSLASRLLVLSLYALYNHSTNDARAIALYQGHLGELPAAIKEDFADFALLHLDDFLTGHHKYQIITSLMERGIQVKLDEQSSGYDFDQIEKNEQNRNRANDGIYDGMQLMKLRLESNHNVIWYKELNSEEGVLYRRMIIKGSLNERNECIDHINEKIKELLSEVKDPFSPCWLSQGLMNWIELVTGFSWLEISRKPRVSDSETLIKSRQTIKDIILSQGQTYIKGYRNNFKKIIEQINNLPEGESEVFSFRFLNIIHEVEVDKTTNNTGLLTRLKSRLLNLF